MENSPWDASDIALIRRLWAEDWSAGKIGRQLNRSRNAVIGFAHRNRDVCPERGAGKRPAEGLPRGRRRNPRYKPRPVPVLAAAPKPPKPDSPPKPPPPPRPMSVPPPSKAALYRMLQKAVLNTGGRL